MARFFDHSVNYVLPFNPLSINSNQCFAVQIPRKQNGSILNDHNSRFPLFSSFSLSVDEPRRRRPRDRRPPRAISRPGKLSHLVQEEDQATGIHIIFTDLSTRLRERLVKERPGFAAVFCGNRWVGPLVIWSESCHSRFGPKGPDLEREIVFEERQKRTNDCLKSDPYSKVCSSGFFLAEEWTASCVINLGNYIWYDELALCELSSLFAVLSEHRMGK